MEYIPDVIRDFDIPFDSTYDSFLDALQLGIEDSLLGMDPSKQYLFPHSSGSDSRIISGTMSKLKKEGRMEFDNVLFRSWGPEQDTFKALMDVGGWKNWDVFQTDSLDTYDVGRTDVSVDGWNPYSCQFNFWKDIDPTKYTLLLGVAGDAFAQDFATSSL